jgi:nitroreductase
MSHKTDNGELPVNVTEAINERHSRRAFLPKPVEKEKLDAVLAASVRALSWANTQPWEIFVVMGGIARAGKR